MPPALMPSQMPFRPLDYMRGRVAIPPEVLALKSRTFIYRADTEGNGAKIANGGTFTATVQTQDDSYFLIEAIMGVSSLFTVSADKWTAQITDQTSSRNWSNLAVPARDLFGKGDSPKFLDAPQLLRPTGTLNVAITNNTGSSASFYFAFIGRKIYGLRDDLANLMLKRLWYQYVINYPNGLGASAVATSGSVQTYNDSDFLWRKSLASQLLGFIYANGGGGALSDEVMVKIRDTVNDRDMSDDKVNARLLFGQHAGVVTSAANAWSNGQPGIFRKPSLIRRNGQILMLMDNKSTNTVAAFNVTLEGHRIFD